MTDYALNRPKMIFSSIWSSLGIWLVNIVIIIVLCLLTPDFRTSTNLINVVRQISVIGIIALGATFEIQAGEINLNQTPLLAFLGCFVAKLMIEAGMTIPIAIALTLLMGMLVGLFCGLIVGFVNVPSFIATLGVQYALIGVVLLFTNSQPITGLSESFTQIGRGYIGDVIPIPTLLLVVLYIIGSFVIKYTRFGRSVLAVGENAKVAELSGIRVKLVKVLVFVVGGLCTAIAAMILAARLGSGQPTAGTGASLQALAAVYVGGTSGGKVSNSLAGTLLIGLINNGLNLLKVNSAWQNVALGAIIICAVAFDVYKNRKALSSVKN